MDVRTEAPVLEFDIKSGFGMLTQYAVSAWGISVHAFGQLPCEFAFRVIGATDEGTEASDLERKLPAIT